MDKIFRPERLVLITGQEEEEEEEQEEEEERKRKRRRRRTTTTTRLAFQRKVSEVRNERIF